MPARSRGFGIVSRPDRVFFVILFLIVTFVLCLPLVLFALSNTEMVKLGLWPTDYGLEVHLSLAILVAMAIAFLLGALVVWMSELGQRRRARRGGRSGGPLGAPGLGPG